MTDLHKALQLLLTTGVTWIGNLQGYEGGRLMCVYLIFREVTVKHQGMFWTLFCHFNDKIWCRHYFRLETGKQAMFVCGNFSYSLFLANGRVGNHHSLLLTSSSGFCCPAWSASSSKLGGMLLLTLNVTVILGRKMDRSAWWSTSGRNHNY